MKKIMLFSAVLPFAFAACASNPPPVTVEGDHAALASLAGHWTGSYTGYDSGRSGSIIFVLEADGEAASGDVLMIPRQLNRRLEGEERAEGASRSLWPQPIGIRFVHAETQELYGELDEYRDPACGCRLQTTFRGTLVGDRIEGTFHTRHLEGGVESSGTWHVERN